MKKSKIVKSQFKTFSKEIKVDSKRGHITCKIQYDDECGNGHNSFSITGDIYSHSTNEQDAYLVSSGCIHDKISKYFPEFKHLVKWHLMNSDAPFGYLLNTLYYANESLKYNFFIDSKNKQIKRLYFFNVPEDFLDNYLEYKQELEQKFLNYNLKIDYQDYRKSNNIDEKGLYKDYVLFNYCLELESFLSLHNESSLANFKIEKEKGDDYREINLEAARCSAVWEDATLEQLQDEKLLKTRLPKLIEDFIVDIEKLGFIY